MKIKRRRIKAVAGRKLACFAAAFSACLWAFCYGLPVDHSWIYGAVTAAILFVLLWMAADFKQAGITILLASLLAGGVFHYGIEQDYIAAQSLDGYRGTNTAEVTQYPREGGYYTAVEGARLEGSGLGATILIYETGLDLQPGDRLVLDARTSFEQDEYFFSSMAEGGFLTLRCNGEYEVIRPEKVPMQYLPLILSHRVRQDVIGAMLEGDEGELLSSLLTGGTEGMSQHFKNALSLSGTSHITSVSGLHMAVLSGAMIALFGRIWGALTALPLMIGFGMLTGMDPPVIRSILMLSIIFLAYGVDRENDGITTVLTTLMVIGITDPYSMVSLSLQLSFAAVAGLMLLADPIRRTLALAAPTKWVEEEWVGKLLSALSVSIAASISTLPLTALHFDRISILSPLANLAVLWLISTLMLLGAAAIMLWIILPPAARLLARMFLSPLLRLFMTPVTWIAGLPFSSVSAKDPLALVFILIWGMLLILGWRIRPRHRLPMFLLAAVLTIGAACFSFWQNCKELTCTVYGDGMVTLQQGSDLCVLAPGQLNEDLPASYVRRLYNLGETEGDLLAFSGIVPEDYALEFNSEGIYSYDRPKRQWLRNIELTLLGNERFPAGILIEWQDTTILYACSAKDVEDLPEGIELDLLILDQSILSVPHRSWAALDRYEPDHVVVCYATEGQTYDPLVRYKGKTDWLMVEDERTITYTKESER